MSKEVGDNVRFGLQVVIVLLMGIGAWFANEVWAEQKTIRHDIATYQSDVVTRIAKLDIFAEVEKASRFSAQDWIRENNLIVSNFNNMNRRLDKADETLAQVSKTLSKLEEKKASRDEF